MPLTFSSLFAKTNTLELISLHIPKTAGTSFRLILESVYGSNEVMRVDLPIDDPKLKVNKEDYNSDRLPKAKVIHGHFNYELLSSEVRLPDQVPIVTWVRDPVERVISNYFYLSDRLESILDEKNRGVNILSKLKRNLKEYAQCEINRNRQSKFLKGLNLDDITFIGVVENFEEEIKVLAKILGWKNVESVKVNSTKKKDFVDQEIRDIIYEMNLKDVELYNSVLERKARY